jgi:glycine/D-amino acid oxidase-like deaminating enzyme
MNTSPSHPGWGATPWTIEFRPERRELPAKVDFAVVGGGFTGLAAAAWLRLLAPEKSVALLESGTIGAGASGRTGGLALAETAVGDLPGLGDVLAGYSDTLRELGVECELALPGVWELARQNPLPDSPIAWSDSGNLRAVKEVPGGTIDPGKAVSGLARAAEQRGALIFEWTGVEHAAFGETVELDLGNGRELRAGGVLFASNAQSLEMTGLAGSHEPKFTLATATEPFTEGQLTELGLTSGKPFYTIEMPYLWGRLLSGGRVIFGAGLVHLKNWRELESLDVSQGPPAEMFARFEQRVRKFHPVLRDVQITHRWGGPILVGANWNMRPVFRRHPDSPRALVLGAYSGHGVALSVYLGRWAAEALLGRRELPQWDRAWPLKTTGAP